MCNIRLRQGKRLRLVLRLKLINLLMDHQNQRLLLHQHLQPKLHQLQLQPLLLNQQPPPHLQQ
jgi:hypothetical protein